MPAWFMVQGSITLCVFNFNKSLHNTFLHGTIKILSQIKFSLNVAISKRKKAYAWYQNLPTVL